MKKKEPVNLEQFRDIDEDALVEGLSPEEIADLNAAIDPEVRVMNRSHAISRVIWPRQNNHAKLWLFDLRLMFTWNGMFYLMFAFAFHCAAHS